MSIAASGRRRLPTAARWRRRLRNALLLVALIAAVAAFTRLDERLVAAAVGRIAGVELTLGELDWPRFRPLKVHEIAATLPGAREPFFTASSATLDVSFFPPRLNGVALDRPRLVLTEEQSGRFDVQALERDGGAEPADPPPLSIDGGLLEVRGAGPLNRRLREFLAPEVAATLAIDQLEVTPGADGATTITGQLIACGAVPLELSATARAGRLLGGEARVDRSKPLDLVAMRRTVAAPIARWLEANALTGRVALAAQLVDRAGAWVPSVEVDLRDVALKPEQVPLLIERLGGRVALRDGALLIEGLHGGCGDAALSISGRIDDVAGACAVKLAIGFDHATLDDAMRAALRNDRIGRMMLDAFEPEGRWSCLANIEAGRKVPFHLELDIGIDGMAGVFRGFMADDRRHGFPMRFERIHGRVFASPDHSWFRGISGHSRSGGRAEAGGTIDGNIVRGDVVGEALAIDDELLAAVESEIGPEIPELLRELGLGGTFAVVASYELDAASKFTLSLALTPRAVSLAPRAFPYPVVLSGGTVRVDDAGVHIEGVRGTAGSGSVEVDGTIARVPDPPFSIRVRGRGLEWDAHFAEACRVAGGAELAERLAALAPEGRFDVDLEINHPASGAPLEETITIRPLGAAITVGAGVRAHALSGAIVLRRSGAAPFAIELCDKGLTAQVCGGYATLKRGEHATDAAATDFEPLDLAFRAISLGPELRVALATFAPAVVRSIERDSVRGALRGRAAIELRGAESRLASLELAPDRAADAPLTEPPEITAAPPWLPLPLSWRVGAMQIEFPSGHVSFGRVEGRVGDARAIVGGGTFEPTEQGLLARLDVDLDGLSFGEFLELILGDERRVALRPFGPLGRTRAVISELTFQLAPGGDALARLTARGSIDARGWTFYTGGALRELTGRLEVADFVLERQLGTVADVRASGSLVGVTLQLGDERFAALDADLLLDGGRLSLPWIAADFAGGRLPREKNHFALELAGEMPFDGRFELEAADVSRLLGDDHPSMRALVGRVDLAIGLRGHARSVFRDAEVTHLEAEGSLRIADAKLWSIPIFEKLYSAAVLPLVALQSSGAAEPPRWTRGAIDFAFQGVNVKLSKVELEGEPLILRGSGTLGPDRLRLDFYPELRSGLGFVRDLPLVGWAANLLFSLVERQVGAFVFLGPYKSPYVVWNPVSLPREDFEVQFERPRTSSRRAAMPAERF